MPGRRHGTNGRFIEQVYDMGWVEEHSQPVTETGCWIWSGYECPNTGYGKFRREGEKNYNAHRFVFNIVYGYLPKVVMHTCDNRLCVNPDHLEAGDQQKNLRDMVDKGRGGAGMFKQKIPNAVRDEIRHMEGTLAEIAKIYNIDQSTVSRIKNGKDRNRTRFGGVS